MRLFFALWPPAATARALAEWAKGMEGRHTAMENIHLTLAFLGEADLGKVSRIRVPGRPFELKIDRASYWRHNRILWVGSDEMPPDLQHLVTDLHARLKENGFVLEERPFAAHVTLIRKANPPASLPPLPVVAWPAAEFALVRSAGGRYETVQRFPLR